MADRGWTKVWRRDLSEAGQYAWDGLCSLWKDDVLPLLTSIGIFLIMAAPIILVILVLWYLDSIGWSASPGFYTIGN